MTIIIQTRKTSVPVQIGELEFAFDTADKNLETLAKSHETIAKKLESIKGNDIKAAKKAMREGFDLLLGEGSFEQIYDQTPSIMQCLDILVALVEAVTNEMQKISGGNEKLKKYLAKKK